MFEVDLLELQRVLNYINKINTLKLSDIKWTINSNYGKIIEKELLYYETIECENDKNISNIDFARKYLLK